MDVPPISASLTITNLGDHLFRRTNQHLVTMKFSMLAIAATAFAGVQGFAPVANPSARVMAMQVRRFPIGCFGVG